ncbi:MAG TPA: acyl-CoA dehydratase activase [Acidobacteriota bacterium]|nr:acyl-CoA dehydratase activase [Acidobacteriota bacterium]
MGIILGIDTGSVSVKLALLGDSDKEKERLEKIAEASGGYFVSPEEVGCKTELPLLVSRYRQLKGEPAAATMTALRRALEILPENTADGGVTITGSGGRLVSSMAGINLFNEFRAIARAFDTIYPQFRTIFEMGGETSKYILLQPDPDSGRLGLADYEKSGDCAAGTGSFIDQQALRLQYKVEEIGALVEATGRAPTIAGRCSVFAKTDMIHAQQKGYKPPEILKGLCEAVSRNFKSAICKGKDITPPVAFIGGVAKNKGIVNALTKLFELEEDQLIVPPLYAWMGAIGAAMMGQEEKQAAFSLADLDAVERRSPSEEEFPASPPLDLEKVELLRNRTKPYVFPADGGRIDTYLGIDVGSISTNLVVIDADGNMVYEIYARTLSRPIEVVDDGLQEIEREIGDRINIKGVATTGSGRELIGELVGADSVNDEITAHQTGAKWIAGKLLDGRVDTIFEIGGQDSKFIRLEDGIVVDFTMNDACAAGTGSFLEERADELGISIKGEFAEMALRSKRPIRMGERCTVFIETDVKHYLKRGAPLEDVVAGLAYSVAYNYINRVVRGRDIGGTIFFQGGTAYNDAVAAAFTKILDREIVVPPHNGVVGAYGVALLARDKMQALGRETTFRGFSLKRVNYTTKEFTCKGCTNYCDIIRFDIEGSATYWGDRCSDRYRKKAKVEKKPVIPDLFVRHHELLLRDYDPDDGAGVSIGIPRTMFFFDRFPFWNNVFRKLGARIVLSDETNRKIASVGQESVTAEPCFPIKLAHGHIADLFDKEVDYILIPNNINAEAPEHVETLNSVCPWNTTLPWVAGAARRFFDQKKRFISPTLHFRLGPHFIARELAKALKPLGFSGRAVEEAVAAGFEAQGRFNDALLAAGEEALQILDDKRESGIVLLGRPYNIYDPGSNLSTPDKLRSNYGVNVIPLDFLPINSIDITDVHDNMYWNYGRRIIAAAKFVHSYERLHLIYITNFKCGPDSYIKHYIVDASGKPFLTLQYDGHANDAGIMTRCEAYLESKGMLRWWTKN